MKQIGEGKIRLLNHDGVILSIPIKGAEVLQIDDYIALHTDILADPNTIVGFNPIEGEILSGVPGNLPHNLKIDSNTTEVIVDYTDFGNTNQAYRAKFYLVCDVIENDF